MKYESAKLLPLERRTGSGEGAAMRVASHGGNINLTCTELDEGARLIVDVKAVPPESRRGPVATLELAKPGKAGSSGVGWPETLRAHWRIEPKDSRATFAVDTLHDCK